MKPDPAYLNQTPEFWANVRAISELCGYTQTEPGFAPPPRYLPKAVRKRNGSIKVPTADEIVDDYSREGLKSDHIVSKDGKFTDLGESLNGYFKVRAAKLAHVAAKSLMNAPEASELLKEQSLANEGLVYPLSLIHI